MNISVFTFEFCPLTFMSAQEYLARMKTILCEGGKAALGLIDNSRPTLKKDGSVVTLADEKVSQLAHTILQDFLQHRKV